MGDRMGKPTRCEVLAERRVQTASGQQIDEVELRVPEELAYFDGHFPGDPLLPGVYQLDALAVARVEQLWSELGRLARVRRLKFIHPLRPGDRLTVRLERRAAPGQVALAISQGERRCTTATLQFEPPRVRRRRLPWLTPPSAPAS